jgi:hypothetical protein
MASLAPSMWFPHVFMLLGWMLAITAADCYFSRGDGIMNSANRQCRS